MTFIDHRGADLWVRLFIDWLAWGISVEVEHSPGRADPLGQWRTVVFQVACFHLAIRVVRK